MTKTNPDATVLSTSQPDEALGYATRLLEHFVAEHFPHNPDWKPLPDLLGVLTQIDNAITIARDYKARLAAPPASPLRGITDEMLNAHLKATAEWVDPYEAATECGVPIECGITQDDADELNAQSRASLRVGYTAAFASPPEQPQRNLGVASDSDRATTVPDRTTDATPRNDPQEPTSRDSPERRAPPEQPAAAPDMFRCNCPHEVRSGCSEPRCVHYTPPRTET